MRSLCFLLFCVLFCVLIHRVNTQPSYWGDVCTLDADGESTNCYLWTGAPFPFNDIGSFLKNNPFCPIHPGQKCNVFISPVLMNCQVTTLANDTSGMSPPQGCQFYKPVNATPPSSVILCNLDINCNDRAGGVAAFLASVYTAFNISMNNGWLELISAYAVSDMFGGRNAVQFPNSFFRNLFNPIIDVNDPPPVRIQWDGPISITTPFITLDSMWAVARLTNPSIPYLPVNVLVSSPLNSPTPNALPTCNVLTVLAPSVSVRNMAFFIDPTCNTSTFVANTRGTIVYTVTPDNTAGIGAVEVVNLSSTATFYPLVYALDNYQSSPSLSIETVVFDSSLDGHRVPPPSPPIPPPQTVSSFASIVLQFGGTATVDTKSPGFIFATSKLKCVDGSSPVSCTTFVDANSLYTGIDANLLGCQSTIYSNSDCEKKNSTDLALVISTSILLAALILFAVVELCRRRRNTLDRAVAESAAMNDKSKVDTEED